MGVKRVKMELMQKEQSRLLTFRKRKASLLKKASEFSILCGVDVCVIVSGPRQRDGTQPVEVETWPSNPDEVRTVIRKFKQSDRDRKTYTLSDYFADKKKNADAKATKVRQEYFKAKYPASAWNDRLNNCSSDQLSQLLGSLNSRIELVDQRRRMIKASAMQENQFRVQQPFVSQHGQLNPYNPILTDQESLNSVGNGYPVQSMIEYQQNPTDDQDAVMNMLRADHQNHINQFQPRVEYQQNLMDDQDAVMKMLRAHQNDISQFGISYCYNPNNDGEFSSMNYLNSLMTMQPMMPTYTHLSAPSFLNPVQVQPCWQVDEVNGNNGGFEREDQSQYR